MNKWRALKLERLNWTDETTMGYNKYPRQGQCGLQEAEKY
jgi:hypothetical protein